MLGGFDLPGGFGFRSVWLSMFLRFLGLSGNKGCLIIFGTPKNLGYLLLGSLEIRILQFRVLYYSPLFSETPTYCLGLQQLDDTPVTWVHEYYF